jgi:4-hydroxybenzoyl-CoA thioesterase
MTEFNFAQKILFQHCDPAGIVFYPRYFEMLNACVEAWCEERLDYSFAQMHGVDAKGVPSVHVTAEFRAPSKLGEKLILTLIPTKIGRSSANISVTARCGEEIRVVFTNRMVFFSRETGRSEPWPDALRHIIEHDLQETTHA